MSLDSEWKRVTGNPDNIIVSDSIRDLLDPDQTETIIKQDQRTNFTCTMTTGDTTLNGNLCSYQVSEKEYRFSLELPMSDVSTLIGWQRVDNVTISNSGDLSTLEIHLGDDDPDPEISVEIGSSIVPLSSAFVSIVISK